MGPQALPNGSWHITGSQSVHHRAHTTFPRRNICTGTCIRSYVDLHVTLSKMAHAGEGTHEEGRNRGWFFRLV